MKNQKIDMSRLSVLQKEQVNLALEHGLDIEDVKCFAKPCYNFRKMEEIRLFLEKGEHNKIEQIKKKGNAAMWLQRDRIVLALCTLFTAIGLVFLLSAILVRPSLILTTKQCEIDKGEVFDAMQYISSWSNLDGTLYLPENIDTSSTGTKLAVYRLEAKGERIVETLQVVVK